MLKADRIVQLLEAGLRGSALRGKVIANNLANLETPGYRRKDVRFAELLADALDSPRGADLTQITPEVFEPLATPVDSKGNDVNLDTEIGEMVKNGALYKTYLRLLNKTYKQMEAAIGSR